jgi:hypothetical protein
LCKSSKNWYNNQRYNKVARHWGKNDLIEFENNHEKYIEYILIYKLKNERCLECDTIYPKCMIQNSPVCLECYNEYYSNRYNIFNTSHYDNHSLFID